MKNFLKRWHTGVLIILVSVFGGIHSRSREISSALSQELAQINPIGEGTSVDDKYIQSEAHLQTDEVKRRMATFQERAIGDISGPSTIAPNEMVTPYLHIVAAALNKEVELKNSHYVFYQGTDTAWRVPQDLYKRLHAYYKPLIPLKDFRFLRFSDLPSIKAQDFLRESVAEWGGVSDKPASVRDILLSTNLALFGNVNDPGECTWNYFVMAKSHRWPLANNYYEVLKTFDVTYDIELLAKEAQELSEMLCNASKEQMLLQIFIPQNKVDEIAYLAWIIGFPAHKKSTDLMEKRMEGKPRVGAETTPAVTSIMKKFKKEKMNNPIYRELVEAVESGDFGIRAFMDVYRNDPFSISNINELQARILTTKELLGNPASGIKIFSYFTTPRDIQEDYLKKLDALALKIIEQEKNKTEAQKDADRLRNEEIFERIKIEEAEELKKEKAAKKAAKQTAIEVQKS